MHNCIALGTLPIPGPPCRGLADRLHQRHQLLAQSLEQDGQLGRSGTRLIVVQERMVERRPVTLESATSLRQAASCRLSWIIFSNHGRKRSKRASLPHAIHSCWASEVVLARASTRSRGSLVFRS